MRREHMRDFWNARAREDALFFVDDRRQYGDPEMAAFWEQGERDLDQIFGVLECAVKPDDDVLDIGCGVGRLTRVLAGRARHVYAIDVSSEMLERARQYNPTLENVTWLLGDGFGLDGVEDASVDAVVSHVVFQHIPDPQITLGYVREMGRVLRDGGWAAFQISNDASVHREAPRGGPLSRLLGRGGSRPKGQDDPAWLGTAVELDDLRAAAADGGMEIERMSGEGTQFCVVLTRRTPR